MTLAGQAWRREQAPAPATPPSGRRNKPSAPQQGSWELDGQAADVSHRFGRDGPQAEANG